MKFTSISGVCVLSVVLASGFPIHAAKPSSNPAQKSLRDVLLGEQQGKIADRQRRLELIRQSWPQHAPAQWQSGKLHVGGKWMSFDRAASSIAAKRKTKEYLQLRAKTSQDLQGHLRLATWCHKHKLTDRLRAHLVAVLQIAPNHAAARRALGYLRLGSRWISRDEVAKRRHDAISATRDLKRWSFRAKSIREGLASGNQKRRERAGKALEAIDDSTAVAAVEMELSDHSPHLGIEAIEFFDRIKHPESTVALARQAVFSRWNSVRTLAATKLKGRKFEHFVPHVLSATFTPVRSRMQLVSRRNGTLLYRHVFFQEGRDAGYLTIADNNLRPLVLKTLERQLMHQGITGKAIGIRRKSDRAANRNAAARYRNDSRQAVKELQQRRNIAVDEKNQIAVKINGRVRVLLSQISQRNFGNDPKELWDWWESYSEVWRSGPKPLYKLRYTTETVQPVEEQGSMMSCLVAGTPVWTERGLVAIDKVRIGDRVLAKNVETGELAYKPVLRTTVRPARPLLKLNLGSRTIRLTGGHPFWISGLGWTKARDIKPGMSMHNVTGTTPVRLDGSAPAEKTYNLIVADFHTYFVGASKVLSHDNTPIEPTAVLVPGLARK